MKPRSLRFRLLAFVMVVPLLLVLAGIGPRPTVQAGDWPQWMGENRNGKVTGFEAPKSWPKELTKKWKVTVGDGVATPALVGGKLYVFSRVGGDEVIRCLEADSGKEIWAEKYATPFSGKGDQGFPGPRSSPAVADGMVVTFGVNGTLSCLEAATGKKVWRLETGNVPMFHTSSSPIIAEKLAIAQIGSERSGSVVAYELATGKEKWKWSGDGTAYASLALLVVGETRMIVAETSGSIAGLELTTGKELWKAPMAGGGMRSYNAPSPVIEGQTVVVSGSGRGTKALKIEKSGDGFTAKTQWTSADYGAKFNTPILANGLVYGLTERNALFCISAKDGKMVWDSPLGGGGGRQTGYGSIVDAGTVLLALTPNAQLVIFEAGDKEFKQLASYKVGTSDTYGFPILTGKAIFVKDRDSLTRWEIE